MTIYRIFISDLSSSARAIVVDILYPTEVVPNGTYLYCVTPYYEYFVKRFYDLLNSTPKKVMHLQLKQFRQTLKRIYKIKNG